MFVLVFNSLYLKMYNFLAFQLGEVEVSNLTLGVLIFFSSFTFLAVGISSYKLYNSLISNDNKD